MAEGNQRWQSHGRNSGERIHRLPEHTEMGSDQNKIADDLKITVEPEEVKAKQNS